jgi:hypothetical protein
MVELSTTEGPRFSGRASGIELRTTYGVIAINPREDSYLSLVNTTTGDSLSLPEVQRATLGNNGTLKSATTKWAAMKERVPQVRAWDDPMTGGKLERFGTTSGTSHSRTGTFN